MRRILAGSAVGIAAVVALGAVMFPLRAHLSVATTALVLVIPVVAAVAVGGFPSGVVGVAAGFLVYDFVFIPPYRTLSVGAAQNWVALGVYAVVMLLVTRVVGRLDETRELARRAAADARRVFALSDLLVQDRPRGDLLTAIVATLRDAFGLHSAALVLPAGGRLQVAAWAGDPVDPAELARLQADSALPVRLRSSGPGGTIETLALASSGRPVGMLLLRGAPSGGAARELLGTFANHAAIALERAQLREQAVKAELLEEVDRLRRSLVGAVSHDLRTPLATIKVATTTLLDPDAHLPAEGARELVELMDEEADRLTRLVTNLLDMTRIQAGALDIRRRSWPVAELLARCVDPVRRHVGRARLEIRVDPALPPVDVDQVLIGQVLANLVDNAARHAPVGSTIAVEAGRRRDGDVEVAVRDAGPGVPPEEREALFDSFVRFDTGGRSGLGLAIAKAFVEAHGGRIWVEDVAGGGARFAFTVPAAASGGRAA